jgi:hypothetical protein
MKTEELDDFADRIASAPRDDEEELFEGAITLFGDANGKSAGWREWIGLGAFNELAVAIFDSTQAECGFQFGAAPRQATRKMPGGLACTWRAGDAHTAVYRAATPALALLYAAVAEGARRADAFKAAQCSRCGGLGWFMTSANTKHVCQHDQIVAQAAKKRSGGAIR